ncbi:zeta toxin family protein [Streptomyces sp. NPDC093801]|uniref:zeta toxin family protein n=1 Tax=Streptomyces sp. NPDC093801 TaxID=3155203 RepID=UPI00344E4CEC
MAEAGDYFLTEKELADLFDERVRDFVFRGYEPQESPPLVLVGGQPAAGKSQAMKAAVERHGAQLVPLTGDELRFMHPRYAELLNEQPMLFPNATGQASGAWVRMSIDYAFTHGYGLMLEGVFRDAEMTVSTAERFAATGRPVEIVGLAVSGERSRLDSLHRYLDAGRWTPPSAHDSAYEMMPRTIAAVEASPAVRRITLTDRTGTDLYVNERLDNGLLSHAAEGADTLRALRARQLPPQEASEWLARYQDVVMEFTARGEVNATTSPLLHRLALDSGTVAAMLPARSPERLRHEAVRPMMDVLSDGPLSPARPLPLLLVPDAELVARSADLARADRAASLVTPVVPPPDPTRQLMESGASPELIERARTSAREDSELLGARESRAREQAGLRLQQRHLITTETDRRRSLAPEAAQAENTLRLRIQETFRAARTPIRPPAAPAPRLQGPSLGTGTAHGPRSRGRSL